MKSLSVKLLENIEVSATGCLLWRGSIHHLGYGQIYVDGKTRKAHRVVYELMRGPIPDGRDLDHLCRVRNCVNPYHLEPVTHRENVLRGQGVAALHAKRTHCSRGHEFSGVRSDGGRRCIECERLSWERRKDRANARRRAKRAISPVSQETTGQVERDFVRMQVMELV